MRFAPGRVAFVVLCVLLAACTRRPAETSSRRDRNLITQAQLQQHHFTNAYEAVAALRSNWLLTRGPDSFNSPSEVQVYLDNTRLGGVSTLRTIATNSIVSIRYIDGLAATARWGLDHGAGVIFISTQS